MKIECPKCQTGGKLDPTRVPDGGANIRCPSCGAVFFVQKPGDTAAAPVLPTPSPETSPGKPQGVAIGNDPTRESFNLTGSAAQLVTEREPTASSSGVARREAARANAGPIRSSDSWKVKNSTGMVYDFPDTDSIRSWLQGRSSHSELQLSSDDGKSWQSVSDTPALTEVKPRGFRTSTMRVSESMQQAAVAAGALSAEEAEAQVAEYRSDAAKAAATRAAEEAERAKEAAENEAREADEAEAAAVADKEKKKKKKKKKEAPPKSKRMRDHDAAMATSKRNFRIGTGLIVLLSLAAFSLFLKQSESRETFPESPAGQQLAWVIQALNGDCVEMASAEIEQHFVPASLQGAGEGDLGRGARLILNELRYWHDAYPNYEFDQLLGRTTDTYLEAVLSTSAGEAGVVGLEVEPDPPFRIISMWIRPIER